MAYTTTGSVSYAETAYDMLLYFALRPELYFDQVADVKPTNQSMPGASVVFSIQSDLAIASTALNESTDITPVAMSSSQVTLTLAEYGSGTVTTAALRGEAFIDIDEAQANVMGYNAGVSIDEVAKGVLQSGNNVTYSAGATGTTPAGRSSITPNDTNPSLTMRTPGEGSEPSAIGRRPPNTE